MSAGGDEFLEEDGDFYRGLFEHMLNGFVCCRMDFENGRPVDFVHLKVNRRFGQITGFTDVVGRRCSELVPDLRKSDPELFETFGRVALSGETERFVHYVVAVQAWFSIVAYSPRPAYFVAVFEDISARKRAEQELRSSEAALRDALDYSPNPVFIVERDGRFSFANRQAEALLGYTRCEIVGKVIPDMLVPDEVEKAMRAFHLNLSGQDQFIETVLVRKDGGRVIAEINGILLPGGEVLAEVRDITAQRVTEERLRSSEGSFRAIFERSPVGISICGVDQRVRLVNPAMCGLLGYNEHELVGMRLVDIVHPEDVAPSQADVARLLSGEAEHLAVERRYFKKNGEMVWVSHNVVAINRDGRGEMYLISLMEDITARRELEQERLKFAHQQRETLVREVHHRIKNNLQSVAGLLQRELGRFVDLDPRLEKAISQVDAIALVHGLQSSGTDEAIRLGESIDNICRTIAEITQQHVLFRVSPGAAAPAALLINSEEAVSLALVLNELVLNAVKHSPPGAPAPVVTLEGTDLGARVVVRNALCGGLAFDIGSGLGLGTGLRLVRSMLPHEGAQLRFEADDAGFICAILDLGGPVISADVQSDGKAGGS